VLKLRTLLVLAGIGGALVLGGCVAFTGPITSAQLDVIGKVRVSFTICAENHPNGPGGPDDHPGCDQPTNSSSDPGTPNQYQLLMAFRVPSGTPPPTSFSSTAGEQLTFTRSASYEQQLQSLVPAPGGEQWLGYISNVYSYDAGPDGAPAKTASFAVDFALPTPAGGRPYAGPFTFRPVVGGRGASGSGPGSDPNRPVSCGDGVYGGDFGGNTDCIDSPGKNETLNHLQIRTRDLGLTGSRLAASPGKRVDVPFTAGYVGDADPNAIFRLSATTDVPHAAATPKQGALVPKADSSNPLAVSVKVPRNTPAGSYLVALTAKLSNGQERHALAALRIRDRIAPVARALQVAPNSFVPFPDTSSVAAAKGARVSYSLSEAATVRFTVQRLVRGRYRSVKGSFRVTGKKGGNSFHFTGFVRHRRLRPGRYRLVGVPVDQAKNKGKPVRAGFRIQR
jgi:hypothetical protein